MLFHLSHLGVLKLQGKETANFLQGQLTADIRLVENTRYQPAALCNLQGKVMSLMSVCQWGDNFFLILPQALLEVVMRTLAKPAQFSRVQITEEKTLCVMGYMKDTNEQSDFTLPETTYACLSNEQYLIGCIDGLSYFLLMHQELAGTISPQPDHIAWHQARLKRGDIEIYAHTTEQFVPHQLNLQNTACISFNKGCYRGQEIITRTHYRGTLKYAPVIYQVTSKIALTPGMKIYDSTDQILGELVDMCPTEKPHTYIILASLRLEHPLLIRFESDQKMLTLEAL